MSLKDDLEAGTTELRHAVLSPEQQRQASEDERSRLNAILASMADAVIVVDADGRVALTNQAYRDLFGIEFDLDLEDESGVSIDQTDAPRQRAARGEHFSMAFAHASPDGQRRRYEANGRAVASGGGVVVMRDVTERSLQRIQSDFVVTLSHELRTPLTGLTAYLEMVLRRVRQSGDQKDIRYLERAVSQAHRFSALVGELFDANRMSSGRMTYEIAPTDLRTVVEEAIELAASLDEHRLIEVRPGRSELIVMADAHRLQQVIFNLVANALRHAPNSERIEVRLRKRGRFAELDVQDWGPGIAEDRLPDLFQRGDDHGPGNGSDGLGLGLYIAKGIVDAHDGTIAVDSAPGKGTTFRVRIPLVDS